MHKLYWVELRQTELREGEHETRDEKGKGAGDFGKELGMDSHI